MSAPSVIGPDQTRMVIPVGITAGGVTVPLRVNNNGELIIATTGASGGPIGFPGEIETIILGTTISFQLYLFDQNGDLPTTAEITPGTHDLDRQPAAGGGFVAVETGVANSETDGVVLFSAAITTANGWAEGDIVRWEFTDVSVTIDGSTTEFPPFVLYSRVNVENDISARFSGFQDNENIASQDYTTEATLVTWNTAEERVNFEAMLLDDVNFTSGDELTMRFYERINGTERLILPEKIATVGGAARGHTIIDGGHMTSERIRVTLQSSPGRTVIVPISATAINHENNNNPFA